MAWASSTAEGFRRRAQTLTWAENLTLLYRAVLPVPVWYKYFEGSGMGMVLCALTTGEHTLHMLLICDVITVVRGTLHAQGPSSLACSLSGPDARDEPHCVRTSVSQTMLIHNLISICGRKT